MTGHSTLRLKKRNRIKQAIFMRPLKAAQDIKILGNFFDFI